MKFIDNLYLTDEIKKKKNRVLRKIKAQKFVLGLYIITLPSEDNGLLEIYPQYILLSSFYNQMDITVVGLAFGKDEAIELTNSIISDCYFTRNDFDIKTFIAER